MDMLRNLEHNLEMKYWKGNQNLFQNQQVN